MPIVSTSPCALVATLSKIVRDRIGDFLGPHVEQNAPGFVGKILGRKRPASVVTTMRKGESEDEASIEKCGWALPSRRLWLETKKSVKRKTKIGEAKRSAHAAKGPGARRNMVLLESQKLTLFEFMFYLGHAHSIRR